jgi:hypothetical protein
MAGMTLNTSAETRRVVAATFPTRRAAEAVVRDLLAAGYTDSHIGVITKSNEERDRPQKSGIPNDPTESRWEEGSGIGAAAGAATGIGLGLAVAANLLPPVGPLIAGGTLIALLASAGAGATVGTVVGGLIGLGIPEDEATYYEDELNNGRTLVTVQTDDEFGRAAEANEILARHGGLFRDE